MGVEEVIVGELDDPAPLERSVTDVKAVYHIGPSLHPREREIGFGIIDAAARAGIAHFIYSSVLHAIASDLVQHEIKRDIEEHLLKSGMEYTILQPCNYILPLRRRSVFADGIFKLSWALERYQSMVDLDDVAEVVLKVLADPAAHSGATYELSGIGRFTAFDITEILTKVAGRDIVAERIDPEDYFKAWFGADPPESRQHELKTLQAISAHYSAHDFIGNPKCPDLAIGSTADKF